MLSSTSDGEASHLQSTVAPSNLSANGECEDTSASKIQLSVKLPATQHDNSSKKNQVLDKTNSSEPDKTVSLPPFFNASKTIHCRDTCISKNCTAVSTEEKTRLSKLTDRFQHGWLMERKLSYCEKTQLWWLLYEEGQGMFCFLCHKHDTKNSHNNQKKWNKEPSVRYKRSQLDLHIHSQQHQNAIASELTQRVSVFHKVAEEKAQVKDEVLFNAFLSAYWLAKEEVSNRKLSSLINHLEDAGLQNMKYFAHRSARSIQEMFLAIGNSIQDEVIKEVKKASSFGLLVDEVTDIAVKEQLLFFIQFVAEDGTVKTKFITVKDVLEDYTGANSETLHAVITSTLGDLSIQGSCLASFVTDGASVMVGKNTGLAVRLKQSTNPHMINIHCICHRLALACSDAAEIPYLKEIEDLLIICWKFFEYSPKRMAAYVKVQQELHALTLSDKAKKVVSKKLKKATRTRWLSLNNCISGLYQDYLALVQTFRSMEKDPTAYGLQKKIDNVKFLGAVYILHAVLPCLASLSKAFQKGNVHFAAIAPSISYTLDTLDILVEKKECINTLKNDISPSGRLSLCGFEITPAQEQQMANLFQKYVITLKSNINRRFEDSLPVITAFQIFDPTSVPPRSDPSFTDYGKMFSTTLANHFFLSAEDRCETLTEWTKFKYDLLQWKPQIPNSLLNSPRSTDKREHNLVQETPTEWALKRLLRSKSAYGPVYPKLLHIAEVCLSMPVSNAWPERGASALKRLKTRLRSQMKNNMLDALMQISINGPPPSECHDIVNAAVDKWRKAKIRRKLPLQKSCRAATATVHENNVEMTDACVQCDSEDTIALEIEAAFETLGISPDSGADTQTENYFSSSSESEDDM